MAAARIRSHSQALKEISENQVTTVLGSGGQLGSKILAERREKYLADVFSAGANTIHDVLYKAQALEPIKSALTLPEVIDASKWYEGEHRYMIRSNGTSSLSSPTLNPDRCSIIALSK
jgi:hypothetical protein